MSEYQTFKLGTFGDRASASFRILFDFSLQGSPNLFSRYCSVVFQLSFATIRGLIESVLAEEIPFD